MTYKHVNRLRYDIDKIKDRTTEVERRVGVVEDTAHTTSNSVHTLQQQVKALQAQAEDAENHNRHNNVKILDLPRPEIQLTPSLVELGELAL